MKKVKTYAIKEEEVHSGSRGVYNEARLMR